ncbi:MAG TPA: CYCXC family (seleno)protein [Candidatus Binataceae bacterium]|nr:CYCXC family (seleno)protein [Candidatus Binataceae bacterium]
MRVSSRRYLLLIGVCLVIAVGAYAGYSKYEASVLEAERAGHATLDPALFTGEVRQAYQVVRDNPALIAQLHCYCGCDRMIGHKNLLDCYRDRHGSRCEICVNEVLQAKRMADEGDTVEQIRDALRARYHQS